MSLFNYLNSLPKYSLVVPATDPELKNVIKFVLESNQITEQKFISNISVITEEAFVNVSHYSGSPDCEVNVYPDGDAFYLELLDSGEQFDPLEVNKNPYTKNDTNRLGGLGILLIKRMSLGVEYRYHNNKNNLLIKIKRR